MSIAGFSEADIKKALVTALQGLDESATITVILRRVEQALGVEPKALSKHTKAIKELAAQVYVL